jgi:hypothetical protein
MHCIKDARHISPQLIALISQQSSQQPLPEIHILADELLARYGRTIQAILFYGSCFRKGDNEGLLDLYLLVDNYRSAHRKRWPAFLNRLLPPNVYYLELPFKGRLVRAKYAVLSIKDFERGTSRRWFHSYLWARFAQPAGLVYVRDDQIAQQVQNALACSVITFITRVLPILPSRFCARDLWRKGLWLSYCSELRPEKFDSIFALFDANIKYYEQLTQAAITAVPFPVQVASGSYPTRYHVNIPARIRFSNRLAWTVRRPQGKLLSALRLLKGMTTFQGGLDYILWKIEQHSGITVEVSPRLKRHPLLASGVLFWRLYRRGAFR